MINFIRFSILIVIICLYAAAFITWEPSPENGTFPGSESSSELVNVLNGWAEKVPSLKQEIQELAVSLKDNITTWKDTATENASLLSSFSSQSSEPKQTEESESYSIESLTKMLSQLKDQLGDTESEEIKLKLQEILDKANSMPETEQVSKEN